MIVGCDRVAANGDVANKVGTYSHALAARAAGIEFVVAGPTSTIDRGCAGRARRSRSRNATRTRSRRTLAQPLTLGGHPVSQSGLRRHARGRS